MCRMNFAVLMAWAFLALCMAAVSAQALEPLCVRNGQLQTEGGESVRLFGVNLFDTHLMWAVQQDIPTMQENLEAIAGHGFNALRVPMNMSYIEPAPDVFPDDEQYAQVMDEHGLKPGFVEFLDALVETADGLGMYVMLEFHELPANPWRYFAGGNNHLRGTGKHGGAICWLARDIDLDEGTAALDLDRATEHVPKALAWLAAHFEGNEAICGIEVPFNEPHGGKLNEDEFYYGLVQDCARAIKAADRARLVFMELQDFGACVNSLPPSSCWRTPPGVDALVPHYYFGMHCPNAPLEAALSAAPGHWVSWFTGYGKPVLIGEYGMAGLRWEGWQNQNRDILQDRYDFFDPAYHGEQAYTSDGHAALNRDIMRACAEQWRKMGAQGAFFWAWRQGIPGRGAGESSMELNHGFDVLSSLAETFKQAPVTAKGPRIAVVCSKEHRSSYGSPRDLFAIAQVLFEEGDVPYHVIFGEALAVEPDLPAPYSTIIVLDVGLSDRARQIIADLGGEKQTLTVETAEPDWADRVRDLPE